MYRSVLAAQHRGAQIDLLHQTSFAVDHRDVIDANLILHHHKNASEHVFDDVLRAEADGHAGHSRARQQRPDVEVHFFQDHQSRDHPDQDEQRLAGELGDRLGAFFELIFGAAALEHHLHDVVA
jgi:hypothetical protein